MHDRPALRLLHGGGESIRGIARDHGPSRNAVRRALADGARDAYHRPSATEDIEPAVREILSDYPHMAVIDIVTMVEWTKSRRTLSDLVARLRPEYTGRTESDAPDASTIRAASTDTLLAGTIAQGGDLAAGSVQVGDLLTEEVDWWTES